jgi:MazG family protein
MIKGDDMEDAAEAGRRFARLIRIMDTLRSENGCPWDREQDVRSIADFFLEEVYEAVDAIYDQDAEALEEELGDVLMEVVFLARLFKEKGEFRISRVVEGINRKMIRRHPHVFGPTKESSSSRVKRAWNAQKRSEKKRESILDGMPGRVPALLRAQQLGRKASMQGFDWKDVEGVFSKVREELGELEETRKGFDPAARSEELGDLLFSVVNLSRHMGVNPEIALHRTCEKFIRRFQYIESRLRDQGREIDRVSLEEMDELWEEAKKKSG